MLLFVKTWALTARGKKVYYWLAFPLVLKLEGKKLGPFCNHMILKIIKLFALKVQGQTSHWKCIVQKIKLNVIDEQNGSRGRLIFPVRTIVVVHGSSPRSSNHGVCRERRDGLSRSTYGNEIIISVQQKTIKRTISWTYKKQSHHRTTCPSWLDWPPASWSGARWTRGWVVENSDGILVFGLDR